MCISFCVVYEVELVYIIAGAVCPTPSREADFHTCAVVVLSFHRVQCCAVSITNSNFTGYCECECVH